MKWSLFQNPTGFQTFSRVFFLLYQVPMKALEPITIDAEICSVHCAPRRLKRRYSDTKINRSENLPRLV